MKKMERRIVSLSIRAIVFLTTFLVLWTIWTIFNKSGGIYIVYGAIAFATGFFLNFQEKPQSELYQIIDVLFYTTLMLVIVAGIHFLALRPDWMFQSFAWAMPWGIGRTMSYGRSNRRKWRLFS